MRDWDGQYAGKGGGRQALLLTLFFLLLELMKTYRASQWGGSHAVDGLGLLLAGVLYFCCFFVLVFLLSMGVGAVSRRWLSSQTASVVAGGFSGGLVWMLLSQYREFSPTLEDGIVVGGLFVYVSGYVLLVRFRGFSAAHFLGVCSVAGAAGLTAVWASGELFLFHEQRADAVTILPIIWVAVVCMTGVGAWGVGGGMGWGLRIVHTAVSILLPLGGAWLLLFTPMRAEGDARPNLVFIVSDSMRSDFLRPYGGAVDMPFLEALAKEGTLFEQSYSLAPWTMPSMSALFSSDYPPGLSSNTAGEGWLDQLWQYGVPATGEALAMRLQAQGYATGAMTANALLWSMPGIMDGFSVQARSHPILLMQEGVLNHAPFLQAAFQAWFPALDGLRAHDTTKDITHYTKAFLSRNRNKPFFLWVHYIDPHAPYDPPMRYRRASGPWPLFYPYAGGEHWGVPLLGPDFEIAEADQDYVRSLYEGELRYIDEHVGKVLAQLNSLGLKEKTYICFTSDHGEAFWEHGKWGHGQSVYEPLVRVPLIFSGPDVRVQRIEEPVSALHLMPTFAALLEQPPAQSWKGRSYASVLRGEASMWREPIFAQGTSNKAWPYPQCMVRVEKNKLVRSLGEGGEQLFDLSTDSGEEQDVASVQPAVLERLHALLDEWRASFSSEFVPASSDAPVGDELMEQLRGMGYL